LSVERRLGSCYRSLAALAGLAPHSLLPLPCRFAPNRWSQLSVEKRFGFLLQVACRAGRASALAAFGLDHDRRTVSQNFRDALHDFRGVIADADHGIRAQLSGMLQHQVQRFLACLFA
jgi:hypothetical protein